MSSPITTEVEVPVAVVGAGPVGLSLALGLACQGIRSMVLERNPELSSTSKAPGIHVRTREALHQWGVEGRFLDAGTLLWALNMHPERTGAAKPLLGLDMTALEGEVDNPGLLILEQSETERLLFEATQASGLCEVRFDHRVTDLDASDSKVALEVESSSGQETIVAEFVVGCDGASSTVRDRLGLGFEGTTYDVQPVLADVRITGDRDRIPWPQARQRPDGALLALRIGTEFWRVVFIETDGPDHDQDPEPGELAPLVEDLFGPGPFELEWASRFTIHRRSADSFRAGRVFLAGDAAHVHSPVGGQGMNGGILDAHNLAWKLAYAVRGSARPGLLGSYDAERRKAVATSMGRSTEVLTRALLQAPPGVRRRGMRAMDLLGKFPPVRRKQLRRLTMIDFDYDSSPLLDPADRCAGNRVPNLRLRSSERDDLRLYDLLSYRPAVLDLTPEGYTGFEPYVADVIRVGPGGFFDSSRQLRNLVGESGWVLLRPDAHIGATGTAPPSDPVGVLERTFGSADPAILRGGGHAAPAPDSHR